MEKCRICGCEAHFLFKKRQLNKYDVSYFKCAYCGSVQTEKPYWLEEAYRNFTFAIDTGMVARTLFTGKLALALAIDNRFSNEDVCVDFGGGTGLFTRYLRDYGLNAFWYDKFAKNIFALGFEKKPPLPHLKLLTAFEVFEHLVDPKAEVDALLNEEPDFLLFSTKLYQGQDENWWYFLQDGQHVSFYSKKGLEILATNANYHLSTDGSSYHLFSKVKMPSYYVKRLLKKIPKVEKKASRRWESKTESDSQTLKKEILWQ